MYLKLLFAAATILLITCNGDSGDQSNSRPGTNALKPKQKNSIAILPFKDVDSNLVKILADSLRKKMSVEFVVLATQSLPASAFYKPRQRYIADSLLVFLRNANNNRYEKIIGITTKDISTRKGDIENWGILGLGSCPGEACVVSTFRAGKNKVSTSHFLRRITTLALHELGHTYGLEHCPVATCLMKDAEGKMNLDDGDTYCNKCRDWLAGKAF